MSDRLIRFVAGGFGTGRSPIVPGTVGTVIGVAYAWALVPLPWVARLVVVVLVTLAGVYLCGRAEKIIGATDPHEIVLDEIVAFPVAVFFEPPGLIAWTAAFVIFRVIDVVKPYPIRGSQRLPGGWGVVVDDVLAAFYTALLLQLGRWGMGLH